jgi:protease-4
LTLKLIDQIGDFEAAVKDTASAVGIKGEPSLVRPAKDRRSLLDLVFGDASEWLPDRAKLLQKNPGFYFLWK